MKAIRALLAMTFYMVTWDKPQEWGIDSNNRTQMKWNFEMHPRKIRIYIAMVLVSPLVFLYAGVKGIWDMFSENLRVYSWSSYEIYTDDKNKPKDWEAYKRF